MQYSAPSARIDYPIVISIGFLLVISTAILFSVEARLFPLQWVYIIVGIFIFWLGTHLDSIVLKTFAPGFFALVIVALIATLILGIVSKGSIRWLPLGPLTIQPSEFAKLAIVLATAWLMSGTGKYKFLLSVVSAGVVGILIFIQPDLGTTLVLLVAWFGALVGSGVSFKSILRLLVIGLASVPFVWLLLAPYQKERVMSFAAPHDLQGASYQSTQAMVAAGSGGLFGRGLGQGSQTQLAFLPEHHTDFIFASIGEELGILGMAIVLISFFILLARILDSFSSEHDPFTRSVFSGIFAYLFFQVFVNVGMNLGMLPIAGVPLPLVSAGGSALISTMFVLGIVIALKR